MQEGYASYQAFRERSVPEDGYLDTLQKEAKELPSLSERSTIIDEMIDNYRDERYASVINLVLPQIEFLIWVYAAYVNKYSSHNIFSDVEYRDFWQFNTEDYSFRPVRFSNAAMTTGWRFTSASVSYW